MAKTLKNYADLDWVDIRPIWIFIPKSKVSLRTHNLFFYIYLSIYLIYLKFPKWILMKIKFLINIYRQQTEKKPGEFDRIQIKAGER